MRRVNIFLRILNWAMVAELIFYVPENNFTPVDFHVISRWLVKFE